MQSFYDLQALIDYRLEQRRAEADRERIATQAHRAHALLTPARFPGLSRVLGGVRYRRWSIPRRRYSVLARS
jgi:hypothetical protein